MGALMRSLRTASCWLLTGTVLTVLLSLSGCDCNCSCLGYSDESPQGCLPFGDDVGASLDLYAVDYLYPDVGREGGQHIRVRWLINGSTNGKPDGQSFDSCDDVGAETVVLWIRINTGLVMRKERPCSQGEAPIKAWVGDAVEVKATLFDGSGAALLREPIIARIEAVQAGSQILPIEIGHRAFTASSRASAGEAVHTGSLLSCS